MSQQPATRPGFRALLDLLYVWFARNRLRLTGRAPKLCEIDGPTQEPAEIHSGMRPKSG